MLTIKEYAIQNELETREVYRMIERGELETDFEFREEVKRKKVKVVKVK